jgi:hypothetical protein
MKWITRKNIKVDRVACPWLIKRFIDPDAEFIFVEEAELLQVAREKNATAFDAPRLTAVKLNHRGPHCTFEVILDDYALHDTALRKLAVIVRAADVQGQEFIATEGAGLRAIAEGFANLRLADQERLARGFPIYDALYSYVQQKGKPVIGSGS